MSSNNDNGFSRKQFMKNLGGAIVSGGMLAGAGLPFSAGAKGSVDAVPAAGKKPKGVKAARVAADPTDIPDPINRSSPKTHNIELESKEVIAEIEEGVRFRYMTFGGKVPGPMIRVRQGDTVNLTLTAASENAMLHNIDLHAVYGTGGGSAATYVTPGQAKTISFKAMYPGAFIYHCAVPRMDYHISSGMYGMIMVEPKDGLPEVDHEFYFGQNEVYTQEAAGAPGMHEFNHTKMKEETPTYVVLNGEKNAITSERQGPVKVKKGDTARVFMVTGGPNLTSNFHPIGNVWTKAWREGAIASEPERYVQTCQVAPGSCGIFEMEFPVAQTVHLVDHALSRVVHKGNMANIVVEGTPDPDIYNPNA